MSLTVACAPPFGWVVAPSSALLLVIAGHDVGVHIQRDAIKRDLLKHPALEFAHHRFVGVLSKAAKQSPDGLEVGHALDAKEAFEQGVVAGDFTVL